MTPRTAALDARPGVRPVLKWAGGKRQLLPVLRPFYPPTFARYFEPFVGSGAVFLDLLNSGRADGREVRLSDIHADIIGCYRVVRDQVEGVIEALTPRSRREGLATSSISTPVRPRQPDGAVHRLYVAGIRRRGAGPAARPGRRARPAGAQVALSNSFAPEIGSIYGDAGARAAGLRVRTVEARRAINSRAASRGPVLEYLITTVTPGG